MSYSEGKTPCLYSCTAIQQNFSISPIEKLGYSFREAYNITGKIVNYASRKNKERLN